MNALNQSGIVGTTHTAFIKAMVLAGALLAPAMVSAESLDESNLAPFSAASIGMAKKANAEQATEQEQQALRLLQQSAPAQSVGEAAAAAVKSLAPSLSAKSPSAHRVQLMGATPMTREQVIAKHTSQPIPSSSATSEDPYRAPVYHSFAIFDASSRLFEDFDYDGFYQTFSVTFEIGRAHV